QASKRVQGKQQKGLEVTLRDYHRQEQEAIIHGLINDIIDLAKEHKAMIVTEDLDIRIRGKFYRSAWKKMYKFLEYKCRLAGVPLWRGGIWAAYSSQICIYCGELNKDRRRDGSPFMCPSCGAVYHSDEGAGVNIARRVLYRKVDWEGKGGYRAFHRSFVNQGTLTTE
ncbi:MAG: transposase, partial [Planctomycetes bacterium]|nr:transposase [Planctomycetota bacterium]